MRQTLLDSEEEQMIIKSAYASNHELIKKIEQSGGTYLHEIQDQIQQRELYLLTTKCSSTNPYLEPGQALNQRAMFTSFKPYLGQSFAIFNDGKQLNKGTFETEDDEGQGDVVIAKMRRFDFENALRDVENWTLERLTDFLVDLPPFKHWSRKQARKLLQTVKYERVLKGWEKQRNGAGATEKGTSTSPDGLRLYVVLEGEFQYETADKEGHRAKKSLRRDFDIRKLLFSRKKVTIDDRKKVIVSEERRLKMTQDYKTVLLMKHFRPQQVILQRGQYFGEEAVLADDRCQLGRSTISTILEKLVSSELVFRLTCKSLEGLVMSISADEFIRMLASRDDPSIAKLREQFAVKTKIRADKMNALENGEDYESSDDSAEEQTPAAKEAVVQEASNPIRIFRQKQREFVRQQKVPENLNSMESIPRQTARNASLEASPRQEDTARSLAPEAKPVVLANQSSANFRSFLLNQREIDYR